MIYWIGFLLVKLSSWIFYPCTFVGREHLPKKGGFLIASNHVSNLDPMIVGSAIYRRCSYMAKESLFKNKIFGFFLHHVGAFSVKRGSSDFGAIRETFRRLERGEPVILFPESTRKKESEGNRARAGVGFLAVKAGVVIVPAFIQGADKVLPPGAKVLKRHRVKVFYGKPIDYRSSKNEDYTAITNEVMDRVYSLPSTNNFI